jgi:formylglycine-generating enzyme required for sulfatase activity
MMPPFLARKLPRCFLQGITALILGAGALTASRGADPPAFTNSLGAVFRKIPAGEFLMGSPKAYADAMAAKVTCDWYRDSAPSETPPRRVKISRAFWMGAHEITLGEFRRFVEATGHVTDAERDGRGAAGRRDGKWVEQAPGFSWKNLGYDRADNEPVNNVSWNDAVAFCAWLSQQENATYRLPTEAEWEYACRAGATTPFFWGDDESRRNDYVWSGANSGGKPHPVGQLKPNAWGLHDMNGNVYEYTADGWSTNLLAALGVRDPATLLTDPRVPANVEWVVLRSASWGTAPVHCRSAFRGGAAKDHRNQRDGFRIVRDVEAK